MKTITKKITQLTLKSNFFKCPLKSKFLLKERFKQQIVPLFKKKIQTRYILEKNETELKEASTTEQTFISVCEHGKLSEVQQLLQKGNLKKHHTQTLIESLHYGQFEVVGYLIQQKIGLNAMDAQGNTSLIIPAIQDKKLAERYKKNWDNRKDKFLTAEEYQRLKHKQS